VIHVSPLLSVYCGSPTTDSRIFVNYRNGDEPFGAALIDQTLCACFGTDRVFFASRSIQPGADYAEALNNAVRGATVLLAVIGCRWSMPRLSPRPFDWAGYEIAEALSHGVRVVPVLLDVDPPGEAELPADLQALARCQYVRLRHRHCTQDLIHLVQVLTEIVPLMPIR
jgi:TIR domain